jgi:AcrR family transcriptional regulator
MGTEGDERRARHLEERRQAILEAAALVFSRRGFDKATTREVARAADISEGTIYNYFASKQEILAELARMVQTRITAIMPAPSAVGDDRAMVVKAAEDALDVIGENAIVIRGLLAALWHRGYDFQGYLLPGAQSLVSRVEDYLRARMAAGAVRPCDAHAVARMVMGMVIYLAVPYLQGVEPVPSAEQRHELAELLASLLFDGLKA